MTQDVPRFRWRLVAACMVLTGLAMTQSPGLLVADTKLDLAVAPLDFLARAAHLWDGEGAFGQLQNQAYGYLWPMGPFFALGFLVDLPGWVVQRLWMALVLCVAFTGAAKVARALGVRSDLACILGGLAFALSPRMLTVIGPSSIEMWPSALAPWVLLPLVVGAERGSPRRAAALSALAIAMVGGVNAAATSAVLPLGALWLLTRSAGPRRRQMMIWWPVFTLLGTLWWLVPLFLLGSYSPPFLDYIESAANTTFPTTLFDALRGTSNWVAYVDEAMRSGNDLLRLPYLAMNSTLLLAAGLVGLTIARNPHRGFLLGGVFTGLALVTMGHSGAVEGWFAPQLSDALDGVLAPLRNVHKFDPVLRLPLAVGVAWLVDGLLAAAVAPPGERADAARRLNGRVLTGIVVVAVAAAAMPAAFGRMTPASSFEDVPDYWAEAASWLGDNGEDGTTLLVPGSSFGSYLWGFPRDEPLQALASTPWAVRNAVPLAPAGNIRMLDAIERRMSQGLGSPGLTAYLQRAGIRHLLVRNDLARSSDVPDPVLVHQAIDSSPGIRRAASFGPLVGGSAQIEGDLGKAIINGGWQEEVPALEVFEVEPPPRPVEGVDEPVTVVGGPEDLLDLADLSLIGDAPVVLAADETDPDPASDLVLTDGLRAVERGFGRVHDSFSDTQPEEARRPRGNRVSDYLVPDADRWSTHAVLTGADEVSASSSQSEASASGQVEPGASPYAALDRDPTTAWRAGRPTAGGRWWEVDFGSPRELGPVTVEIGAEGTEELQLVTDDWESPPLRFDAGGARRVEVPGATTRLRIRDLSGRDDNRLEIAEVRSDAIDVRRRLVLPEVPGEVSPDAIALRRVGDRRNGCAVVEEDVRCAQGRRVSSEEHLSVRRTLRLPRARTYPLALTASPRPGRALDQLVMTDQPVSVTATTVGNDDVRAGAVAAVDGDPATTWTAAAGEIEPELLVTWLGKQTITGLALSVTTETAARRPESLELRWPGGRRTVELDRDGSARFRPIRTDRLTLHVIDAEPATDLRFDGTVATVPVGVSELRLVGLPYLPVSLPAEPVRFECGSGPTLEVNGDEVRTRVTAAPADLAQGEAAPAEACRADDEVALTEGTNRIDATASDAFLPEDIVLGDVVAQDAVAVPSSRPSPVRLEVGSPSVGNIVTHQNANRGWVADGDGGRLAPRVFDGWRQGWRVDGSTKVVAVYTPDTAYRASLVVGGLALLVLLVLALRRAGGNDRHPPATTRRFPPLVPLTLLLLTGGVLAGTAGVVLAALAELAAVVMRRRDVAWAVIVPAALLAPAGAAYFFRPWGGADGWAGTQAWPQLCVLAACCAAAAWVAVPDSRRRDSATAGRSTVR